MQTEVTTDSTFAVPKQRVKARFDAMTATSMVPLIVDYTRDGIWDAYHNAFDNEEWKQNNACNCCKSFIRSAGAMVTLNPETAEMTTLWGDHGEVPDEYKAPFLALDEYVRARSIKGLWQHNEKTVGTDKNLDRVRDLIWTHYYGKVPQHLQGSARMTKAANDMRSGFQVFQRGMNELTVESVETTLELIAQGSLYRGEEHKKNLEEFLVLRRAYQEVREGTKEGEHGTRYLERYLWAQLVSSASPVTRLRNTSIGQLLIDLSEGKGLEPAVKAFENMVAPANYKRPKALVTPRMIQQAKEKLEELGYIEALNRRKLDTRDLSVADALFVYRSPKGAKGGDVFDQLTEEARVDPRSLTKVEEVPVDKFLQEVVPNATSMRVLIEREHFGNLVTLTGPQDTEAPSIMAWDNSYGWSYTGGVADSIKKRVKAAGGRVDNVFLRASLSWHNTDDLDLHMKTRGEHVHFGAKRAAGFKCHLDIDMNAGGRMSREPVENIYFEEMPPVGRYEIYVNQYTLREDKDVGFDLEIEVGGEMRTYGMATSPRQGSNSDKVVFNVTADGNVTFEDCPMARTSSGVTKWGMTTGQFHRVNALTTSPNHWTKPQGNKHLFFLLEGCVSDEKTRPFYNEMLCPKLAENRKVMETLGGKIAVADAEGAELSGLGFSETKRDHLFIEVEGKFKRTIKVVF